MYNKQINYSVGLIYVKMEYKIEDIPDSNSYKFYPNPTSDYLFYKNIGEQKKLEKIMVYDVSGRRVAEKNIVDGKIEVSELIKGLYFIRTEDGSEILYKFLKE